MTTPEPRAVGDIPPNVESHSATTTSLNTDIDTLIAFENTAEAAPVKAVFESVTTVLTLVGVGLFIPFKILHALIEDTTRMG